MTVSSNNTYHSTNISEETPLLRDVAKHDEIYDKFSVTWKRLIVLMVSFCGVLPCELPLRIVILQFQKPTGSSVYFRDLHSVHPTNLEGHEHDWVCRQVRLFTLPSDRFWWPFD